MRKYIRERDMPNVTQSMTGRSTNSAVLLSETKDSFHLVLVLQLATLLSFANVDKLNCPNNKAR